jgi:predicted metal-binding membrane protein
VLLPLLLYAGGWLLMSTAMMLPTTLPLLNIFRRSAAAIRRRSSNLNSFTEASARAVVSWPT